MLRFVPRCLAIFAFIGLAAAILPPAAQAGTTGHITGRVVDSQSQSPIAGAVVTVVSPSQSATSTTDASGTFRFLSLAPDAYTIAFSQDGYDPVSQTGISVFADQTQTINVALVKTLKTIARVTSRSSGNLVKAGTTSDVYSVNAATAQAAGSLIGPGGLSNAYGAIASVPGVVVDSGEVGWFQQVHIRGGDLDQVGYELDGIPVNRVYDNAPQTMLSSLGQQELQVYTGGTPASADAQGIAGYVNQVVKTGTYPGAATANLSAGSPAFFHRASFEAGGSSPDRSFSYYIGISGANQDYRYVDRTNGAGSDWFFYPMTTYVGGSDVYTGGDAPNLFAPGNTFSISNTNQRDTVMNFHFAIPHKHSPLRDDVQFLYLTSQLLTAYSSSVRDIGVNLVPGITGVAGATQLFWNDGLVYDGPSFAPVQSAAVAPYFYASAPEHPFGGPLPVTTRDINDNGVAVAKLQYQHAFNDRSFLRAYGYSLYSNWFIDGPNSANESFGAEIADYEIPDHTYGGNVSYTNQINNNNLLALSGSYTAANLQRYSNSFFRSNPNIGTLVDASQNCYDGTTGAQTLCYDSAAQLSAQTAQSGAPAPPAGSAAALNGAQYLATATGLLANLNQVHSRFSAISLTDEWRPNDRTNINLGLRMENFTYLLGNTSPN
ncbi:MAG TPA: carboxypeptidase regulatory-like domain-containing protein, partial [Candidatus Baltobacteraceae bacterium]|nr:carboxypeptidase regulatory-like domain-containing protein [Candidatus Baltobacteraceae bacterium]